MTYPPIQAPLEHMKLHGLTSYRSTCPACGGHNTFGMTYFPIDNTYVYQCYKLSCNLKGKHTDTGSMDSMIAQQRSRSIATGQAQQFKLPTYLIKGVASYEALQWLNSKQALDAWKLGLYKIYTDVKENRIVIPLFNSSGVLANAIGRAWNKTTIPKARIYGKQLEVPPFIVGTGKTAVIVEDFASAAHVAVVKGHVGYAILGTQFNLEKQLPYLKKLQPTNIIVALDKDAISKANAIVKSLDVLFPTVLLPLEKDIKDMTTQELKEIL